MKNPTLTMVAITGAPTKNDIFNYMKTLKNNGIEQVITYPRSGCEIEYLSEKWFHTIGHFIEAAKTLDMYIWLYDEFNWPSGHAGGKVTDIAEYQLKAIVVKGENKGNIIGGSANTGSLFGEAYFPNLFSEKAVNLFIEEVHNKYYKYFGQYFGNIIRGIFTDEPSIGYACKEFCIPYFDELPYEYRKVTKRNFLEDLQNEYAGFYSEAMHIITKTFRKNYTLKIRDWCTKHNILLTGHLMGDSDPFHSTQHNGNILDNLPYFTLPGIDEICTDFTAKELFSTLGVAEYSRKDNTGALAELFALGPCDMSFAKKRCMIFLTACFKINHYIIAGSHMDLRGNMKILDYFNTTSADQPDFAGYLILSQEAAIAAEYADLDFNADVYIKYPVSVYEKYIYKNPDLNCFYNLVNTLTKNQIQWKFLNTYDSVENANIIELTESFEYKLNGTIFKNAQEICNIVKPSFTVTDLQGDLPDDIFVRKFKNNSFIIINLNEQEKMLRIDNHNIKLSQFDIITNKNIKLYAFSSKNLISLKNSFSINYCNKNVIRTMFINNQNLAEVICKDATNVVFAVRNDTTAYIERKKISCKAENSFLCNGLKKLYSASKAITLNAGTTQIKSQNDFKYLPSVFIIGDFLAHAVSDDKCTVILSQRKEKLDIGEYLNYFGKIEFTTEITVPEKSVFLEIATYGLFTRVFFENELLGEQIDFIQKYPIDSKLRNKKVVLKIEQYSSLGPIFADVDYWDKYSHNVKWKNTPSCKHAKFGFQKINWVL